MICRILIISLALLLPASLVCAQGKPPPAKKPGEDYRQFFKTPETPADFWKALQFEIEVGRYDLAAKLLHGMLDKMPDETSLLQIYDKEGMAGFLRLRNIQKWSDAAKEQKQAVEDVDKLIDLVSAGVKKLRADPERIGKYITNLNAPTPEEREYALKELYRSGTAAIPYMVQAAQSAMGEQRANLVDALRQMNKDTLWPILAALDSEDSTLQLDILDIVKQRADTRAVPELWRLAGSSKVPDAVRRKATDVLGYLTETAPSKLLPGKFALTREAERYYQGKERLPETVVIWRWDGKQVVSGWPDAPVVPRTRAEEYWGLRYAGQALDLDPTYQPAQVVFLSLALAKAMEKNGYEQPLAKGAPDVNELLTTINPDLVNAVLDRALNDNRLPVILAATRALGELAEVKSARPTTRGDPAIVRALDYPDRRVKMAAADAVLKMPSTPSSAATARIVEILRRAAAAEPAEKAMPKVIVGQFNQDLLKEMGEAVMKAGYEPVPVRTGREVLRRLNEATDVEAIIIDQALPDPGLSSLVAQLRADVYAGQLPVVILAPAEREGPLARTYERYRNVRIAPATLGIDPDGLKAVLPDLIKKAMGEKLSEAELKAYAEKSLDWLAELARGEKSGFDVRPTAETIYQTLRNSELSDEAIKNAITIAGRLPGARAQGELANVVIDEKRKPEVRIAAAQELVKHIQQHNPALAPMQVQALLALYRGEMTDPVLRTNLGLVMGAMRPDIRTTGEKLKGFTPQPPKADAPPPPPKEK